MLLFFVLGKTSLCMCVVDQSILWNQPWCDVAGVFSDFTLKSVCLNRKNFNLARVVSLNLLLLLLTTIALLKSLRKNPISRNRYLSEIGIGRDNPCLTAAHGTVKKWSQRITATINRCFQRQSNTRKRSHYKNYLNINFLLNRWNWI